ncbi:MAG: rhodanese-like domain-containing protein [Terracidiphilus sp.]|jgi:rhodanese-related sulfurtransferase
MQEAAPNAISIETWKDWQASGRRAQLVDVRSAAEFATAHLPGAINIPLEQVELRTADLETHAPVVLVCQGGTRARLAAGLLGFVGVLLAVTVSQWWLILPGFVGGGFVFAGCTGFCPMGEVLARLPWNRPRRGTH